MKKFMRKMKIMTKLSNKSSQDAAEEALEKLIPSFKNQKYDVIKASWIRKIMNKFWSFFS